MKIDLSREELNKLSDIVSSHVEKMYYPDKIAYILETKILDAIDKNQRFYISNDKTSATYTKNFDCIASAKTFVVNHLDLSLQWNIKQL